MGFTNDLLMRTLQFIKMMEGNIEDKSFLMIGMQRLNLTESFISILEEADLINEGQKARLGEKELKDSIAFFKAIGFKEVHALDVSDYEKADIIFDLNYDLPEELIGKFDIVFDGGVIEHVFDVVKAFKNLCQMTKVGGYIFNINPVYNYLYNTFWNISPEMFLEFYGANKYKILDCSLITFLSEDIDNRPWEERPIIWSPDIRFLDEKHPLLAGKHIRSMNALAPNPHPNTFIVARKTNDKEFIIPIVSGYAKKHKKEKEVLTSWGAVLN